MTASSRSRSRPHRDRRTPAMLAADPSVPARTDSEPVLDLRDYLGGFEDDVVDAYRRGVADAEHPANVGLARSILPPGTAATRDFSHLSPRIPAFRADACVGCMACVSACPDAALIARVIPVADLVPAIDSFVATDPGPTARLAEHFNSDTTKYARVPQRRGDAPGTFGLFVDPMHCKGCAECVEVCLAQGHDALVMMDKAEEEPDGGS